MTLDTAPIWKQFQDCTDIQDNIHASHCIFQAVQDDRYFRGQPRATAPPPLAPQPSDADAARWRAAVRLWLATLPESLAAHFKQIQALTAPH